MLPASAVPSTHEYSLKGVETPLAGPQPWTYTSYVAAVGLTRLTCSVDVPPPLEPTSVEPRQTYRSMSEPGSTSASNRLNLAYVVPAGTTTEVMTTPGWATHPSKVWF